MKKIINLFILLLLNFALFAQEPIFILKKDSILMNMDLDEKSFKQGEKFYFKYNKRGFGVDIDEPLEISIFLYNTSDNDRYNVPINDVYLENYDDKIKADAKNSYWIPSYYYTLLESKNIKSNLLKFESYWKTFDNPTEGYDLTWFDFFKVQRFYFDDFYFVSFGKNVYNDIDFFAYLEDVSDTKIVYNVQKMYSHFFDYKEGTIYNQPDYLPLFEKPTPYKIILIIDDDYMKIYIDEVSEKNLFQTLIRTSSEACNQIENWIKGKSNDLSKVVMPKHGNSSVQTEVTKTNATNVAPNKTMTVKENLKLRSGEATSTQVLTVMQAGTKVKILELGKAEKIDGINSNWVKVEVQKGAKDRDGKPIKARTIGWCYGGYLGI